jgi:hypothetical protein
VVGAVDDRRAGANLARRGGRGRYEGYRSRGEGQNEALHEANNVRDARLLRKFAAGAAFSAA